MFHDEKEKRKKKKKKESDSILGYSYLFFVAQ